MMTRLLFSIGFAIVYLHALTPVCAESMSDDNNLAMLPTESVQFSGYLETYTIDDFNHPANHRRPDFVYSHNVTDRPSINLAMLKAAFNNDRFRANAALGSGTYMRANYANEPSGLKNMFEANVGFKLSDNHSLWLDAGVMPSHIGFESAVGMDNWTLTRSMMADNSPYFETGAKLTYTTQDKKWLLSGLILTGWQRIHPAPGNTTPSFGHQLTYTPNSQLTINSSSFIGNDKSDAQRRMRYFHDLYGQWQINDRWAVTAAFDIGAEQATPGSDHYHVWYTSAFIAKYHYSDHLSFAGRIEQYRDKYGVIINAPSPSGVQITGYSFNVDYHLNRHIVWRNEMRLLCSRDALFQQNSMQLVRNSPMLVTALTLRF